MQWLGVRPLIRKREDAAVKTLSQCGGKHGTSRKGNPAEGPRGEASPGAALKQCPGDGWPDVPRRGLLTNLSLGGWMQAAANG